MSSVKACLKPLPSSIKKALLFLVAGIYAFLPALAQDTERMRLENSIDELRSEQHFNSKDTIYIDLLNELGHKLRFYHSDSLLLLAKQALKHSVQSGYKKGESISFMRMGDYYSDKGDNSKAINYYWRSSEIAGEIKNNELILRTLNDLGTEYGYQGDYAKALNTYLDAIELAEAAKNKRMLSIINENIANLYASQKDYTQALEFFVKVKKINEQVGDDVFSSETMSNLASVYADKGQLDYAMFNINQSIKVFERDAILDWLAFAYEIKGKVYLKEKKYKWALHWYNQSEMLHAKLSDDRGKLDLFNGMAEAYLGQGQDELSQKFALEAYEISKEIQFMEGMKKCAETLYKIYKSRRDYNTALEYHEVFRNIADTLARNDNNKSLVLLKTKMEYDKQKQVLIKENELALAKQENYIKIALSILFIFMVITILVHRSQKIQKRLNTELKAKKEILEKREEELSESSETKTKLFSIIGHDLRGPIAALHGLLNMFMDGEIGKTEFLEFMPKLRDDVGHISFTLNNLLSWGYTQMNGSVTKPSLVPLESLVDENIKLLSEIAKKKSIRIVSEMPSNTITWVDGNQIDIVVRNLLSNALKFTPENGMVTIGAFEKNKHWEIQIRDTGIGMDKSTQDRLFKKNSGFTTYGTNNEKGTGLGLSLCVEMVKKNNGDIWVDSIPRKGTTFYFTLPKGQKEYSKAS